VTRIGCYLFGCDFGTRLPDSAPAWLRTAGTFPHWAPGTIAAGDGSPAFVRHLEVFRGTPLESELYRMDTSFPVHPTQLYESFIGLLLLLLLLWQRKNIRFRGQLFFLFTFVYGFLRFTLELWRDDTERGSYGPTLNAHLYVPACLFLMALGFTFGISLGVRNAIVRTALRVAVFIPAIVAFLLLRPGSFGETTPYQLSTSQGVALLSTLAVSFFYARLWRESIKTPNLAMSLGDPAAIAALEGVAAPAVKSVAPPPDADVQPGDDSESEDPSDSTSEKSPKLAGPGSPNG
jgi:phosphatidylglycerol:prolipoprotein diacylglycerol transferase